MFHSYYKLRILCTISNICEIRLTLVCVQFSCPQRQALIYADDVQYSVPSLWLRSHRREYGSGFPFAGCLSLVQASPTCVERSNSIAIARFNRYTTKPPVGSYWHLWLWRPLRKQHPSVALMPGLLA